MARQTGVEHVNQFITDPDGRLAVILGQPKATVGTAGAGVNDEVRATTYGMSSVAVSFAGGFAPTFGFEVSLDGGSTWSGVQMFAVATGTVATSGLSFAGIVWEGGLPAGATHFRARCTSASGAMTVMISPSPAPYKAAQVVNIIPGSAVALNPGGARVGTVGAQSQAAYANETTTPLAAAGTATGTSYDLAQIVSGNSITSTSAAMKEFRALAVADVTGTLHIEVSADQITWWRISSTATAALGSIFYAQAVVLPVTRYARAVYVNGAGPQGAFLLATARFD